MLGKLAATLATCALLIGPAVVPQGAAAEPLRFGVDTLQTRVSGTTSRPSTKLRSWMSPEIAGAWRKGYFGQGVTMTFVDNFKTPARLRGNLGTGTRRLSHGEWTRVEARMLAPSAATRTHDLASSRGVSLQRGLNVMNLSYGMFATRGYKTTQLRWTDRDRSLIDYAQKGRAVISKAAGNDGMALNAVNSGGLQDYLNLALIGGKSTIFVGALTKNGTTANRASLAPYSNYAGSSRTVQRQFLVVGVDSGRMGLAGTSFAAPVVSGYAAVLGSKFKTASPTQIANQLLSTARTDTIRNYSARVHGRGEASIARALAPRSIR